MTLRVPDSADILEGKDTPARPDADAAVRAALAAPIGSPPLAALLAQRRPRTVAVTVSDITRPVPNRLFVPAILDTLNAGGIADGQVVIIIGTGMHRPSTPAEREIILGPDVLRRVEVVDHTADRPETLQRVSDRPPISVNARFARADFRIVTGFIEPHFMAGFSGGRKGVCPALVDLQTVQRFHGYRTLADTRATNGNLAANPCHDIALHVARTVGVDFLFNVTVTRDRQLSGIYCGDLEQAHARGCAAVTAAVSATVTAPYDLVVGNGGGFPLDQTFYQCVKGMCTALPALHARSVLLTVGQCSEGLGSPAYHALLLRYGKAWEHFLADIAKSAETGLDQWEFQMQARVLSRIGIEHLWFASDALPMDIQNQLALTPVTGPGNAQARVQAAVDAFVAAHPKARLAVIPDGPYTLLVP